MEDQVAKGAAVGILTLGMYVPTPIKSTLTLHAFIFDSEKNEIAFYKKSLPVEKDPTDHAVIKKQLLLLFSDYFKNKKTNDRERKSYNKFDLATLI